MINFLLKKTIKKIEIVRGYRVLSIESSCDDLCVALLERNFQKKSIKIIEEVKKTFDSKEQGGIIPTHAFEFHNRNIGEIVEQISNKHKRNNRTVTDVICCTRGPGMTGSLIAGLQFAKGLSVGWNIPLIGVHHMLGHLVSVKGVDVEEKAEINYPVLSLFCSGGHTMLVHLKSFNQNEIVINTCDISVGEALDKCARELGFKGNMIAEEMEKYTDEIPIELKLQFDKIKTSCKNEYGFFLNLPMRTPKHRRIPETIEFSFASFLSCIQDYKKKNSSLMEEGNTRKFVVYKVQELIFDHIIDRINVFLKKHACNSQMDNKCDLSISRINGFVVSGGVSSNKRLRKKIVKNLNHDIVVKNLDFFFPKKSLCTDNAVMIGLAGIEILEKLNLVSDLSIFPIRKWPLNQLLDVDGWKKISPSVLNSILKI